MNILIKYLIVVLLLIASGQELYSQNKKIDSLKKAIASAKEDSMAVKTMLYLANEYTVKNIDKATSYTKGAIKLAEKISWQKGVAQINCFLAKMYERNANYPMAIKFFDKSIKEWEKYELGFSKGEEYNFIQRSKAGVFANIAAVYNNQADYNRALEYHLKSLKIFEAAGSKTEIAEGLVRIGIVYSDRAEYEKALKNYFEALKVFQALNNKERIALTFGNIGNVYYMKQDYKTAGDYYLKGLKMHEECDNKEGINYDLGYMGALYYAEAVAAKTKGNENSDSLFTKAIDYYLRAVTISEERGDIRLKAIWLGSLGEVYASAKKYKRAEEYLNNALQLTNKMGALSETMQFEKDLSELYSEQKDFKKSFEHYIKYTSAKDSLFNEEKTKEFTRHELNYEFEKKETAARADQEKKDAVTFAESRKQKIVLLLVGSCLIFAFVFAIFIFRSLNITKKQKHLIEIKNKETEEQKMIIEEKNKDILDSIHYARRIQQSLLPSEKYIDRNLKALIRK